MCSLTLGEPTFGDFLVVFEEAEDFLKWTDVVENGARRVVEGALDGCCSCCEQAQQTDRLRRRCDAVRPAFSNDVIAVLEAISKCKSGCVGCELMADAPSALGNCKQQS